MEKSVQRLVGIIRKRYEGMAGDATAPAFALRAKHGAAHGFGAAAPVFTLVANDQSAVAALSTMDSMAVGEAYLRGSLDVEGDVAALLALREMFGDRHPLAWAWKFIRPLFFGQVRSDASFISEHYDEDPEFFALFLDRKHRCYSQGVFEAEDEALETGIERKLDFTLEATGVGPGDRVLDVGGGWGAFTEYAGRKGIQVTSLTISRASEKFINGLIDRLKLPCRVLREHLYAHQPREKYDAIVNLGVTEHLPDYGRTLEAYARLLKPGGRVVLDASATRDKYDVSAFFEKHIFRGNGTPVAIHDYLTHAAKSAFSLVAVLDDTQNYEITCRHWAERLDAAREEIERRWGKAQHRRFQVYLWGCVDGFRRDVVQAYRWVLELPPRRALPLLSLRGGESLSVRQAETVAG